jgi:GNAT superfamily N-acetyltransferase
MIRPMQPEDFSSVSAMLKDFTAQSDVSGCLGFKHSTAWNTLAAPGVFAFVAEDDGVLAGVIVAAFVPWVWNADRWVVQEMAWWVQPEFRGRTHGQDLLKALEAFASDSGASAILMITEHSLRSEAVGAMYKRAGYAPLEHVWLKEL